MLFDEREFASQLSDWRSNAEHPARKRGFFRLRYMPRGVLVKFDDCQRDNGFGHGVVLIRPMSADWKYMHHEYVGGLRIQREVNMKRVNLPLASEKDRTVQSAQGMSMDAAVMMLTRPGTMSEEDWWLHVYVMLSRVRTARQILVYGLPSKQLFERGPPPFIEHGLARLTAMAKTKESHYSELCSDMGFTIDSAVDAAVVCQPAEVQTPAQHISGDAARYNANKPRRGRCRQQVQPVIKKSPKNPLAQSFERSAKPSSKDYVGDRKQLSVGAHSRATRQDSVASAAVQSPPYPSDDQPPEPYEFWRERWAIDCYSTPGAQALPCEPSEQDLQCISVAPVDSTA